LQTAEPPTLLLLISIVSATFLPVALTIDFVIVVMCHFLLDYAPIVTQRLDFVKGKKETRFNHFGRR
jgi:hypothetical protein